jgi:hypothetical protein
MTEGQFAAKQLGELDVTDKFPLRRKISQRT